MRRLDELLDEVCLIAAAGLSDGILAFAFGHA